MTSASASSSTATPRPGPAGTRSVPRRGAGRAAPSRPGTAREWPARRRARGSPTAASWRAAAMPQGPSSVLDKKADSPASRAVRISLAGGLEATAAGQLDVDHVAGFELDRPANVRGGGDRLVGGDRRGHPLAHLGQLLQRPAGLLDELQVLLLEGANRAHRLVHRPRAVGVHPQRRPGPDGLADRGHPVGVVGQADLDLEAGVALAQPLGGLSRHLLGGPAGSVRFTGSASLAGSASGRPSRRACRSRRAISSAALACGGRRPPPPVSAATARSSGTPS